MYKSTTPSHHLNLCKTVLCTLFCFTLIFSFISCSNLNLPKKPSETGSFSFILSDDILAHLEDAIGSSGSTASARSAVTPLITATVSLDKTTGGQLVNPVSISGILTSFRNKELTIEDIPLSEAFIVTITFTANGLDILTGKSSPVTLTSTEPATISISLQYASGNTQFYSGMITGTWAFDYGYNHELWSDDLITFKENGTFETHIINSEYTEWDTGTWSLSTDAQGRQVLALHITRYSNDNNTWNDVDITSYYYIDVLDDELVMNRFKRDRVQEDGWHPVEYYEPAIYNHYYRVTNGNREQLENATWNAVKSNDWWEEHTCTWAFNTDGTMVNTYDSSTTDSIWEIIQEDGRTLLYVKSTWNPDYQEWWYDYTSLGPDLLHVKAVKHTTNGTEDENYTDIYFYRDVPLVKYTYHWKVSDDTTYTFYDYWPKGKEYTTFASSKVNYIAGVPNQYLEQQILGIYTSEAMTGDPVKKISAAANTTDREFWVQWGLKAHHNGTETEFCHSTSIPASDVFPNLTFSANDTIAIHFEADLSKDINGWTQIKIWPEEGGNPIAFGEVEVQTTGRHLSETYLLKTTAASGQNMNFEYVYNQETGPVVFSNCTLTVLDDTNSYKINYHVGDLAFTTRALTEKNFELPTEDGLWDVFYPYYSDYEYYATNYIDFEGWADGTGTPVTTVTGNVGETKDVYMNFTPSIGMWGERSTNDYGFDFCLPVRTLISDDDELETLEAISSTNPITIQMNATIPEGTTISNVNDHWHAFIIDTSEGSDWGYIGEDYSCVVQDGNNLTAVFTLQPDQGRHIPTLDDMEFHIDYHHEFFDAPLEFSNFEIHVLGAGDNWYYLVYHFGNMTYTEKAYRLADRALPTDMQYFSEFEDFDAEIANNLNLDKWYGNADITGYPIPAITRKSVEPGMESHVYMNITPKMSQGEPDENGNYAWFTHLPAQVFFTNNNLSVLSGMTEGNAVTVKMKSEMSLSTQESIHQDEYCGLYLVDRSQDNWERVAFGSLHSTCCESGLWEGEFSLTLLEGKSLPENLEDMLISFEYDKKVYNGDMESNCFSLWIEQ